MDLQQMIDAMGNRSSGSAKTKGSRFTHTEQLIYGKVCYLKMTFMLLCKID